MVRLGAAVRRIQARRRRSKARKLHDQAMFRIEHGEAVRLALVGGGVVAIASAVAALALR
ncbi:MAG: hypothetical protein ABW360_04355 [Phenylobacterium sp.]